MAIVRFSCVSKSLSETHALARTLASHIRRGDVVLLVGELGAGKTAFTKGFGVALGVTEEITSPTFTIMRDYPVRLAALGPGTFLHLDAYRLEGPDAAEDIGLLELLDGGAFALIEWGDIVAAAFGHDPLMIEFRWDAEEERTIAFSASSDGPWAERLSQWFAEVGAEGLR